MAAFPELNDSCIADSGGYRRQIAEIIGVGQRADRMAVRADVLACTLDVAAAASE